MLLGQTGQVSSVVVVVAPVVVVTVVVVEEVEEELVEVVVVVLVVVVVVPGAWRWMIISAHAGPTSRSKANNVLMGSCRPPSA